jgi:hypothetical protein
MKKLINFSICLVIIALLLTSCKRIDSVGGDARKEASSSFNVVGHLITKAPSDFDKRFGYEVSVIDILKQDSINNISKVFVPKIVWERLPEPNDTTIVNIEYIQNIEYGEIKRSQFNLCVGYNVVIKKK